MLVGHGFVVLCSFACVFGSWSDAVLVRLCVLLFGLGVFSVHCSRCYCYNTLTGYGFGGHIPGSTK